MIDPAAASIELSPVAALPLDVLCAVADRLRMAEPLQPTPAITDPSLPTPPSGEEDSRGGRAAVSVPMGRAGGAPRRPAVVLDPATTATAIGPLARVLRAVGCAVQEANDER
jgi:hypothetical protein